MGNEQSAGGQGQAVLETGLRLSTLCRYQAKTGGDEGLTSFNWFNPSTDISGLVLKGAHRWGYVPSHAGGQRLFKDMRQRFFVLLDHYLCYFEGHGPEARMRGSIDLDKSHCQLELLPRPPDRVVINHNGVPTTVIEDVASSDDAEERHHRVEVIRKADGWSMVLCFPTAAELQSWMKTIFDVQQRKATFSPLRHAGSGNLSVRGEPGGSGSDRVSDSGGQLGEGRRAPAQTAMTGYFIPRDNTLRSSSGSGNRHRSGRRGLRRSNPSSAPAELGVDADDAGSEGWFRVSAVESGRRRVGRRHGGRRQNQQRGTLYSPSQGLSSSMPGEEDVDGGGSAGIGGVPLSWADSKQSCEDRSSQMAARLGKAAERLAALPRGGRAPGSGEGINSSLDEYGAFTTAHASIYEGWTRGLQAHGWGRMICASGDYVQGWWEHDVLEGTGQHTNREEGWTYRGGFVDGERHGPGRLETAEGDVWECEWRHGVVAVGVSGTHHKAASSSLLTCPGGGAGFEEVYQGGCAPSSENPKVPCRAGHGRLKRRDGEQVETHFRAGKAVDGAKGVVRFRNGAIFFGQLQDARPHGYGELYLSSVKPDGRNYSSTSTRSSPSSLSTLADLEEMARDILWYKGNFHGGKPHGTGLVKYKEPSPVPAPPTTTRRSLRSSSSSSSSGGGSSGSNSSSRSSSMTPSTRRRSFPSVSSLPGGGGSGDRPSSLHSRPFLTRTTPSAAPPSGRGSSSSRGGTRDAVVGTVAPSSVPPPVPPQAAEAEAEAAATAAAALRLHPPPAPIWGESKEEEGQSDGAGGGMRRELAMEMEERESEELGNAGVALRANGEDVDGGAIGIGGNGLEEDDDDDEASDDGEEGDSDSEEEEDEDEAEEEEDEDEERPRRSAVGRLDGGEEKATTDTSRPVQRPPDNSSGSSGATSGWRGADMEYEAQFVKGVMVRHDPSHLRLAALRFGRTEIRCLETMLRREQEAMARLHSRNLCLLCNTEEMNALLVNCRHRVLCMGCAERAETCPVCHEAIGRIVKTYTT